MADVAIEAGAIDMAQGVIHTSPPPLFLELLSKRFSERQTHVYASPAGYKPYRETLLKLAQQENQGLTLDTLMATSGVTGGLVSALTTCCQPSEKVMLLEPFYPAHDWAIRALHYTPAYVPYTPDFTLDWAEIEQTMPHVKACIIANPANPTGLVLTSDELERLYQLCKQYNVLLIVDEVYREFVWEGQYTSLLSTADSLEHLVILRSFSKNLGLAGWRAGYAITTPERRVQMTHLHDALYVGAPAPVQIVLTELLAQHANVVQSFIQELIESYRQNRANIIDAFTAFGMQPLPKQGAYYMLIQHNRSSDLTATQELLDKGIAVAPGIPFYRPNTLDTGFLRIHFALSQANCEKVVTILSH